MENASVGESIVSSHREIPLIKGFLLFNPGHTDALVKAKLVLPEEQIKVEGSNTSPETWANISINRLVNSPEFGNSQTQQALLNELVGELGQINVRFHLDALKALVKQKRSAPAEKQARIEEGIEERKNGIVWVQKRRYHQAVSALELLDKAKESGIDLSSYDMHTHLQNNIEAILKEAEDIEGRGGIERVISKIENQPEASE